MRDERRRFNRGERVALFLAAGGRCAACGVDLPAGWHGDHVMPYARGGRTDVANGQALCPACNGRKGVRVDEAWPEDFELRPWQTRAYASFLAKAARDFLLSATPGAGKTDFALYCASRSIILGECRRVVVVVPTDHLRKQWMRAGSGFGIQLDDAFSNLLKRGEASDFDGVVVTYAQVASDATLHRALCGATPTFVIFDEIHHAGGELHWARNIRHAFENAVKRLLLTGTPFRSDNNAIPFVHYDPITAKLTVDFPYGYGDAIQDRVCRQVYFPSYEGRLRWFHPQDGEIAATFRDELSEEKARRRLATALDPSKPWLRAVLTEAHQQLLNVRRNIYGDAAGLVVAKDQEHARAICRLLERITGEVPALAVSDDPDASDVITAFADVPSPDDPRAIPPKHWIVAVKMVSEGVNIPRLFVGVFATNVATELYFRQFVGRMVRMMKDVAGQVGYVYIPRDPVLVSYVETIKEEREHALTQEEEREERARQQRLIDAERPSNGFAAMGAEADADDVFFVGDDAPYSQVEIGRARAAAAAARIDLRGMGDLDIARLMRALLASMADAAEDVAAEEPVTASPKRKPLRVVKDELKSDIRTLASRLVGIAGRQGTFFDHEFAYQLLNHATACRQDGATEEQLCRRKDVLKGWIELAQASEPDMSESAWWEVARDARQRAA